MEAVDALHSEFKAVDNLVAYNTTRVLKAFQNARVGSHVSMPSCDIITILIVISILEMFFKPLG